MEDRKEHARPMRQFQCYTPAVTGMPEIERKESIKVKQYYGNNAGPISDPRSSENTSKNSKKQKANLPDNTHQPVQ